ncbi:hypothetical protein ACFUIW_12980 [Streptomyces sp. NPDC057245]|uniref:hypothetical protein n=1 Tax=Streptomyces TaxID=1883 RepID=UPI0020A6AC06|nr:hypothetical protein [Streptomyces sp. A108]MBU6529809.1 hypothetical protein [Streptomyces sp. A108]
MIEALALVARYMAAGNTTYYPLGETVPVHKAMGGDWTEAVHRTDKRGRRRVVRMVYEVVAFQALRDQLKCEEVRVVGADKWRNLDEDMPQDFAERREANCRERSGRPSAWTKPCPTRSRLIWPMPSTVCRAPTFSCRTRSTGPGPQRRRRSG